MDRLTSKEKLWSDNLLFPIFYFVKKLSSIIFIAVYFLMTLSDALEDIDMFRLPRLILFLPVLLKLRFTEMLLGANSERSVLTSLLNYS